MSLGNINFCCRKNNSYFERVCSKFMIKLSRSKVFLFANIFGKVGPCPNYGDKFSSVELITD